MDVVLEDRLRKFADVLPGTFVALPSAGPPRYGLRLVAHELGAPGVPELGAPGFVTFHSLSDAPGFPCARMSLVDPRTRVVEVARVALVPHLDYGVCFDPGVEAEAGDIEIWGHEALFLAVVLGHEHLARRIDLSSGHAEALDDLDDRARHEPPALVKSWSLLRGTGPLRERDALVLWQDGAMISR